MTDCNDLNEQLEEAQRELEEIQRLKRRQLAVNASLNTTDSKGLYKRKILTMIDGTEIGIDPAEWAKRVEQDTMAIGDEMIQELVSEGMATQQRPMGSTGRMINYSLVPPTKANVAAFLELAQGGWSKSKGGQQFMMPFTQQVATEAILDTARRYNADPNELAQYFTRQLKRGGIADLPTTAYMIAKSRWETSLAYADGLEDAANIIEESGVLPPQNVQELGYLAKWAYTMEQMDSYTRRKLGQALQGYQKDMDLGFDLLTFNKDAELLTLEDVTGDSLLAQVIDHIDKGDHKKLRQLAISRRITGLREETINEPALSAQLRTLVQYKKANLFSSVSTWAVRNPVSGISVTADFYLQDLNRSAFRTDYMSSLKAVGYTNRKLIENWQTAWNYTTSAFMTGRQRMGGKNVKEMSPAALQAAKDFNTNALNESYEFLFSGESWEVPINALNNIPEKLRLGKQFPESINIPKGMNKDTVLNFGKLSAAPFATFNLLNASIRQVTGGLSEKFFKSDWGYFPEFRALSAVDEGIRYMSGMEAIHMKAYTEGVEVAKGTVTPSQNLGDRIRGGDMGGARMGPAMQPNSIDAFAQRYADDAVKNWVFESDKLMKDLDIKKLRQKYVGMPAGQNLPDDDLRLKIFNDLVGVPNTTDLYGNLAKQRGDDVTFTGDFSNKGPTAFLGNAVNLARKNPYMSWLMPAFKTTAKGLGWMFDRDIIVNSVRSTVQEFQNVAGRNITREELADQRAKTVVSAMFAGMVYVLTEMEDDGAGKITGSPPADPDHRRDWLRHNTPYSFSLFRYGTEMMGKISMKSIDLFDLIFLQADIVRGIKDGIFTHEQQRDTAGDLIQAYTRVLRNKNSLKAMVDVMNYFTNVDGNGRNHGKVLASLSRGWIPFSGQIGNWDAASEFQQAGERTVPRRYMTNQMLLALEDDPTMRSIRRIMDGLKVTTQDYLGETFNRVPFADDLFPQPTEEDWLGYETKATLFGLPADRAMPGATIIKKDDALSRWITRHGFGTNPNRDGRISIGRGENQASIQMNREEEATYRKAAYKLEGYIPAFQVLGRKSLNTKAGNIERYVNGKTLTEALNLLRKNPQYNDFLETFTTSPSRAKNPSYFTSGDRAKLDTGNLKEPYNMIVNYYYKLATLEMMKNHPSFMARYEKVIRARRKREQVDTEATILGVGRQ